MGIRRYCIRQQISLNASLCFHIVSETLLHHKPIELNSRILRVMIVCVVSAGALSSCWKKRNDLNGDHIVPLKRQLHIIDRGNLGLPSGIAIGDNDNLYVCDRNAPFIMQYGSACERKTYSYGKSSDVPTIYKPWAIRYREGQLYVADMVGVRVLSTLGDVRRTIRYFYGTYDFVTDEADHIYIVPSSDAQDSPLIVQLDEDGVRVRSYGAEVRVRPEVDWLLNSRAVDYSGGLLVCGFHNLPRLEIWDRMGPFIRGIRLGDRSDADIAGKAAVKKGWAKVDRTIEAVRMINGRIFVLAASPEIRIVEYETNGRKVGILAYDLGGAVNICGFDVTVSRGRLEFALAYIDRRKHVVIDTFLTDL